MKLVRSASLYLGVGLVAASMAAWYWQGSFIYHPRPYAPLTLTTLPPRLVEIRTTRLRTTGSILSATVW